MKMLKQPLLSALLSAGLLAFSLQPTALGAFKYPEAPPQPVRQNYHGVEISDPYRWLEDIDSQRTQAWVTAQNQLSEAYLNTPERSQIRSQLEKLQNYPQYGTPFKVGKAYYYWRNNGLQNQYVLYRGSQPGEAREVVLDPNSMSPDGTLSVMATHFTPDGHYLAYSLSQSGSDWQQLRIKDLKSGKDLPDILDGLKFSGVAWTQDKRGFYYNRYPLRGSVPEAEQYRNNRVYFHALGTDPASDTLVYENPEQPEMSFYPVMSEDQDYLLLYGNVGTDPRNRIYLRKEGQKSFLPLFDKDDAEYTVIGNLGERFFISTNRNAPRRQLMTLELGPALSKQQPNPPLQPLIPEQTATLDSVALLDGQLVLTTLKDAHNEVWVYQLDGSQPRRLPLPTLGSVSTINGHADDPELFLGFTSFLAPTQAYAFDLKQLQLQPIYPPAFAGDTSGFEASQHFVKSKDGTPVPVFVVQRKDLPRNGNQPTLLYGYGGFNLSLTPYFSSTQLFWLQQGGVLAIANLRGGGEYGEAWHQAGMLAKKQNVFDDFAAIGQWLIDQQYTRPEKLAIQGGSNGGLLTTATMLQHPQLFGAVISQVPVTDMLRYQHFTVGRYWVSEYGDAEADPEQFKTLLAYSPLHNIRKPQAHPPILVTTADHDDRVLPAHAYKFVAALQAGSAGQNPVLLRVDTKAGHGAGKPTSKRLDEQADLYAFLFKALKMSYLENP